MNLRSDLERLAAVRPASDQDTRKMVGPAERDLLLQSILASPPAAGRPARHHRRYAVPAALTAAAAAAAIVGSIALAGGSQHPAGQHQAAVGEHRTVSTPKLETVAYIVGRTRAALASLASGSLQVITTNSDGVTFRYIYDLSSGAQRSTSTDSSGAVVFDQSWTGTNATATSTVVDYPDKAWWTFRNAPGGSEDSSDNPASIRQQITAGDLVNAGDATINGQPAIHLRYPRAVFKLDGQTMYTDSTDLWVDATTYLPIRQTGDQRFGNPGSHGSDPWQADYRWSATPPMNVTVPIPAGFRHLAGPPKHLLTTNGRLG